MPDVLIKGTITQSLRLMSDVNKRNCSEGRSVDTVEMNCFLLQIWKEEKHKRCAYLPGYSHRYGMNYTFCICLYHWDVEIMKWEVMSLWFTHVFGKTVSHTASLAFVHPQLTLQTRTSFTLSCVILQGTSLLRTTLSSLVISMPE